LAENLVYDTAFHWAAAVIYAVATLANIFGIIFRKPRAENAGYIIIIAGLVIHATALIIRWSISEHGPYMARYEVLSSNAWIALFLFLIFVRIYPRIKPASIFMFPSAFLILGISLFLDPGLRKFPASFKSIWLVLHVSFIKISLATLLIALAFSIFYILKNRTSIGWLERLPDKEAIDTYAYRFAGFGFIFWTMATLSGGVWAYESWGRFWGWDPIETWSLITLIFFGVYLHLRRFFGWKGEKAAYFFMLCFVLSIATLFFVPLIESSIHSEYFR
jgi:cytochrome c-type biogenesis protein CcsB